MDVLIVGLSSIAQRRVIPALESLSSIGRIDIATRKSPAEVGDWSRGVAYHDYASALELSGAGLVYVSLVNSGHERWATVALESGRHVVVDKPAFLGRSATERAVELAQRRGVCLAEATVYAYHPQVARVKELFAKAGGAPTRLSAEFCFPDLDPMNFRYRRELGGGALWDVGPYAVSVGRVFFGDEPSDLACQISSTGGPDRVDTGFTVLATYPEARSYAGTFGFGSVYRNRLDVLGSSVGVDLDRVFTTPSDSGNVLRVTQPTGASMVEGPAGDAFAEFFGHVAASIERREWTDLAADMLADARTLERLRDAAGAE